MKQDQEKGSTNDEELLQRSARGDRQAFEHLYDRYWDKLVWFARGFVKYEEKAEDIVQDTFMKIVERPGIFDSSKKFSTWVYTVVANQCRNHLRNESNRERIIAGIGKEEKTYQNENLFDGKVLRKRIDEAVAQLSDRDRRIYFLRFEQESSIKEIAAILEVPEGTVKSAVFYLLKKISVHIKDYSNETR